MVRMDGAHEAEVPLGTRFGRLKAAEGTEPLVESRVRERARRERPYHVSFGWRCLACLADLDFFGFDDRFAFNGWHVSYLIYIFRGKG